MTKYIGTIILALVITGLSVYLGFRSGYRRAVGSIEPQRDTVVLTRLDTVRITELKVVERRRTDTLHLVTEHHDTVRLPRESVVYQDSSYRAVVSGYLPQLDSMTVYQRTVTQVVTNTVTESAPRLTFGPYAGVGLSYGFKGFDAGMQVGFGIQYRF